MFSRMTELHSNSQQNKKRGKHRKRNESKVSKHRLDAGNRNKIDMARVIFAVTVVILLSSVFSRVIPNKHDLIVVDNPEATAKTDSISNNEDEDEYDPSIEPFIPTKEWQVVKRGQRIPAGLHVRLNFQTKIREAKLMDDDDGARFKIVDRTEDTKDSCHVNKNCPESKTLDTDTIDGGPKIRFIPDSKTIEEYGPNGDKVFFTKSQLKDALKEYRDKLGNNEFKGVEKVDRGEKVKKHFKSMEEIRGEIKEAYEFDKRSDAQIIRSYLDLLQRRNSTEQEKEVALEDLEYYSHQLSNAEDLAKMGGLKVILHYLNQSKNEVLQEKAAKVIAAAVQSNPKVQNTALESGAVPVLLRIMSTTNIMKLRKRTLYALSALLRGHVKSQKLFLKLSGLNHILNLVKNPENGNVRIQGLTLIRDLSVEQKEIAKNLALKKHRYDRLGSSITHALAQHGWCDVLSDFLKIEEYDTLEKVLQAIKESKEDCRSTFKVSSFAKRINEVKKFLEGKYKGETDEEFKEYLGNLRDIAASVTSL